VVLFTAGLEDYASPIADRLDQQYSCFGARLYRPATANDELYPCIKDLSRLGRDLGRCVLVDDTPLAFVRQPDNGIPIYNFRCARAGGRARSTWPPVPRCAPCALGGLRCRQTDGWSRCHVEQQTVRPCSGMQPVNLSSLSEQACVCSGSQRRALAHLGPGSACCH
jgi:NLI interacting factor-like phosphatase